jgi:hypothetical protein
MRYTVRCFAFVFILIWGAPVAAVAADKPQITSQDQLPRFEYPVDVKVADILTDDAAYMKLASVLRPDLESLLNDYDIQDRTTLQGILSTLMSMDFKDGNTAAALEKLARIRDLEAKPAAKLTTGVLLESVIEARQVDHASSESYAQAFAEIYAAKINQLPYEVVGDNLKSSKASAEFVTEALIVGQFESGVQPGVDKTGTISGDIAQSLVSAHVAIQEYVPLRAQRAAVLTAYLDEHHVEKPDIWAARDISFADSAELTPVVIGVWDSGLDTAVYAENLWTNSAEVLNGKDDDGNGYIDDMHGIAFNLQGDVEESLLYPLTSEQQAAYPEMRDMVKGLLDLQANVDSPEATGFKRAMGDIAPSEVKGFIENISLFANFTHGTHVAGIAAAGNPAAELMMARITFDHRMIPDVPTVEQARKDASAMERTIAYFRDQGVRVVNMSWGGTPQDIEGAFEANGAGGTPDERRVKSREIFDIQLDAITAAIKASPDILFVVAAGNSDNDAEFSDVFPSGIDLPNILTVGAVDQAGEETSFSTFGANVDVHANGFQVPSGTPGGEVMNFSGTSMAAPNVANLAGKLLAVKPDLTTSQLVSLITLAADRSEDGRTHLIHPKRSLALLEVLMTE